VRAAQEGCQVTRSYYNRPGRGYAVVEQLQGPAISALVPPKSGLSTSANRITQTVYDAAGQAIAIIEPDPACQVERAADGTVEHIGAACTLHRSYYDGLGRLTATVRNRSDHADLSNTPPDREPRGQEKPYYQHADQNVRTDRSYDAAGNLRSQTDPNGVVTQFTYDRQGRLTGVIENHRPGETPSEQVNVQTQYTYNAQGQRTAIRSAQAVLENTQAQTTFDYDALGRLTAERDALGNATRYTYDLLGRRVEQMDARGQPTQYRYDGLGRLEGIETPGASPEEKIAVTFFYQPTGLRKRMTDGQGTTTWDYDAVGRVVSVTDPFGKRVGYQYDGLGRRTALTYPDGKVAAYTYDTANRLETATDWNGQAAHYTYTARGQVEQLALPNGVRSVYAYDGAGRLSGLTHQREEAQLARYTYTYDPAGNRLSASERLRQPISVTPPGAPQALTAAQRGYDAIRLTWQDAADNEAGYRLERSTDGQGWRVLAEVGADTSAYTDRGLLRTTPYWYRLTGWNGQGEAAAPELITATGWEAVEESGPGGSVTPNVPAEVTHQIEYRYDGLQRLTAAEYAGGPSFAYAYDANGNRTSETIAGGTVGSDYDAANRLERVSEAAYTWDANGNLLSDGARVYGYDAANRLTSVTDGTSTTRYAYNGLGDRLVENERQFVLDLNAGLTQVLQEGTNTYLYGIGRIGQTAGADTLYFLGDALGSARQMVDGSGAVVLTRGYQPYGVEMHRVGSAVTGYGFTGEWQSSLTMSH
jgi:YD repeat-containing protein